MSPALWWREDVKAMFVRAARVARDGHKDDEAADTQVFYRLDLRQLRAVATAPATPEQVHHRSRNRP